MVLHSARGPAWTRPATITDADVIAGLLHAFNREFDEPTPPPSVLARRMAQLIGSDDTLAVLGGRSVGGDADGVAVLRFRRAIWSDGLECYLAELYVKPDQRDRGLGRAIMQTAIRVARERGADTMDIGVDEPDVAARHLYESLGFTNRTGGPEGRLMFVYQRDL